MTKCKNLENEMKRRKKISEATKGRRPEAAILANTGKVCSKETRLKISLANKGKGGRCRKEYHPSLETIDKIRKANTGKRRSDTTKKKQSILKLGSQNAKGHIVSESARKQISLSRSGIPSFRKGTTWIEEYGKSKADEMKAKDRQSTLERLASGKGKYRNTSIELAINEELTKRNYIENKDYFRNKPLLKICNVDFYFPDKKVVIECDGDYWHNREDIKAKDQVKNKVLVEHGYSLYRFWEHDIKRSPEECISKILFN